MNQFRVTVPKDFGKSDLIWTLTSNGKTERAYASLKPEYILDARGIYRQSPGFDVQGEVERNKPPVVRVQGDLKRTVTVGEPLLLTANASDDRDSEAGAGPRRSVPGACAWLARGLARLSRSGCVGDLRSTTVQGLSRLHQRFTLDAGVGVAEVARGRLGPGACAVCRARYVCHPRPCARWRRRGVPRRDGDGYCHKGVNDRSRRRRRSPS